MAYDTTVHDAIEPPQARVADDANAPRTAFNSGRWLRRWRPSAAAGMSICTLFLMTWVVAILTTPEQLERSDVVETEINSTNSETLLTTDDE